MKKISIALIVIAFSVNAYSQVKVDASGKVGIGTDPLNKLDVAGDVRAAGNIYLGNDTVSIGTTGNFPLKLKVNNTFAGFTGNPVNTNVIFGYGALNPYTIRPDQWDLYQRDNTAVGYYALNYNIMGARNTAAGAYALAANAYGSGNTGIGVHALTANETGDGNTAVGGSALASNKTGFSNTAIGGGALCNNTSGDTNTAVGVSALRQNTTGVRNTAIGSGALSGNTSGWFNTGIGYGTSVNSGNLHNTTAIGNGVKINAGNQVRIGNTAVTSIGGQVAWTSLSDGRAKKNIKTNVPGLDFINRLQPVSYNLDLKAIDELQKSDDPKINALRDSLQAAMSPEERKIMEEARINKEKIVYSGFIAQDVEEAAKSIGYKFSGVDVPENGKDPYGLRYAEFVVPLVKAVQELSEQNKAKDAAIALLQEQVKELMRKSGTPEILKNKSEATDLSEMTGGGALLYRNIPNPFNQNTSIKYYLPETVTTAYLSFYDLHGKQLKQIILSGRGEGVEIISGSQFSPGIYLYALIADGQEVDVKRMILTE